MKPYCEPPDLAGSYPQAHADRPGRPKHSKWPSRQIVSTV